MTQRIRLWKVAEGAVPEEIPNSGVGLEKRLEDWLARDISMLDPNLLVVGRQVPTAYGGFIDLLCVDREGFLVVVELKQGQTPREVTAQALDYASWAKDLNTDDIEEIAEKYLKMEGSLEEALEEKFGEVPDALCESHRSIIVAEAIDDSTERIVRYLSELRVPINIARMHAFKDSTGQEMLAQVFLVEPEVARDRARSPSNRKRINAGEMQALADDHGIGHLFRGLKDGITEVLLSPSYYIKTKTAHYRWDNRTSIDGAPTRAGTVLMVGAVSDDGGMPFVIHATRFEDYLRISIEELRAMLPTNTRQSDVRNWHKSSPEEKESAEGLEGTFRTMDEVDQFVARLKEAKKRLATD